MIPYERRQKILEALNNAELVYIEDLVSLVGVSPSTIRRDVNALVEDGEVLALRGGAIKINDQLSELPATAKALLHPQAKRAIAAEAAKLVQDGDVVYLDSGTTTLLMAPLLHDKRIQIVTSNTQIFSMKESFAGQIIALGGDWLPNLGSIVGPLTERELSGMFFDKAFIGASGCSERAGINTFDMREASKKRIVHEQSRHPYVLADTSKFGKDSFCKAIELRDCFLITNGYHELLELAQGYTIATAELQHEPEAPTLRSINT